MLKHSFVKGPLRWVPSFAWMIGVAVAAQCAQAQGNSPALPDAVVNQIAAIQAETQSWTPAQRKMDSKLVLVCKRERGERVANGAADNVSGAIPTDTQGRAKLDIRVTEVTQGFLDTIAAAGGAVISRLEGYDVVGVVLPINQIEGIAARADVISIQRMFGFITRAGAVTTEGDVRHEADKARSAAPNGFGVDGTGVTVGVISDGVDKLAISQAAGELPGAPQMQVINGKTGVAGQDGVPLAGSGNEGTAMLEIVHDLAPGANLRFATAGNSEGDMAGAIRLLRDGGANIIVDDIAFFGEAAFQDDVIAKAVSEVANDPNGPVFYFSAAGNAGSTIAMNAGVFEGDFNGTPFNKTLPDGQGNNVTIQGQAHLFQANDTEDAVTKDGLAFTLHWADPLGASSNDYDLYLLNNAANTVVDFSATIQDGNDDPFEFIDSQSRDDKNNLVIVVKKDGSADRFFHLNSFRGSLSTATTGQTHGHSVQEDAFGIGGILSRSSAQVGSQDLFTGDFKSGGNIALFGGDTFPAESFTSEGPRRIFFNGDGTAITPGNFSSTGGKVLSKPDFAAASTVSTSTAGFLVFPGTSAAAPHAAAIAALLVQAAPTVTLAQMRTIFAAGASDIKTVVKSGAIVNGLLTGDDNLTGKGVLDALDILGQVGGVTISIADKTVSEGAGMATLTVTLNQQSGVDVLVDFTTADGTAKAGSDFTATNGTLTIASGQTQGTIDVPITDDNIDEPDETFTVKLSNPRSATLADATALGTIQDNDNVPMISVAAVNTNESGGSVPVTVTLSNPSSVAISVELTTTGTTATEGSDFTDTDLIGQNAVNFAPGETTKAINVPLIDDNVFEGNESFRVDLANVLPAGAATIDVNNSQANPLILDDEAAPTIAISDASGNERNPGDPAENVSFTISISGPTKVNVTGQVNTADGTATSGADFDPLVNAPFTINAGTVQTTVNVNILHDNLTEGIETFTATLSGLSANVANAGNDLVGVGSIIDDEFSAEVSVDDLAQNEGDAGQTTIIVPVRLSANSNAPGGFTVQVAFAEGTATTADDGVTLTAPANGILVFAGAANEVQNVTVTLNGDVVVERDETFTLTVSNPNKGGVTLVKPQGTETITNDDTATVTIAANDPNGKIEGGAGSATDFGFTVTLDKAIDTPVSLNFATADGTATTADNDYLGQNGNFNDLAVAGQTKAITVTGNGDTKVEANETFTVTISEGDFKGRAVVIPQNGGTAAGAINNDDSTTVTFATANSTVDEGVNPDPAFNVSLDNPSDFTVTVPFTVGGTATGAGNSDFTPPASPLTFNPGVTQQTITVPVTNNDIVEPTETVTLTLDNPTDSNNDPNNPNTVAKGDAASTSRILTINDDDTATLNIAANDAVAGENEGGNPDNGQFTVTSDKAFQNDATVDVQIGGSAANGTDYDTLATMIALPAGALNATVDVKVKEDNLDENDETVSLTLTGINAQGTQAPGIDANNNLATVTISDDDATPVANNDGFATDEDTQLVVAAGNGALENDTDADDGNGPANLNATLVAGPANGTLNFNAADGTFTYDPNANFNGNDSFTYTASDANPAFTDVNTSAAATVTITVNPVNDPPAIGNFPVVDLAYVENDPPTDIDGGLTITDVDDDNLELARVRLEPFFPEDQIGVDASLIPNGVADSANADPVADGFLEITFQGTAAKADYQALLRTLDYENTSDNPRSDQRLVTITVNDGDADTVVRRNVVITPVNDPPVIANPGAAVVDYPEGTGDKLFAIDLTITDPDDANIESGMITFTANGVVGEDNLSLPNPPAGIGFGFDGQTLEAPLNGAAPVGSYQDALRQVIYHNPSRAVTSSVRKIGFRVNDGDADSNLIEIELRVIPINNAPVLITGSFLPRRFTEGGSPVALDTGVLISPIDSNLLQQSLVRITNPKPGDELFFSGSAPGINITFDPNAGILSGTGNVGFLTHQAFLRGVRFRNTSENPDPSPRIILSTVSDGQFFSNQLSVTVEVVPVDDPVQVGDIELSPALFQEKGPAVRLTGTGRVLDPDGPNPTSMTVSVVQGFAPGEDVLAASGLPPGLSAAFDSAAGVLTISGQATVDAYTQALRSVTYHNTSSTPNTAPRRIAFQVVQPNASNVFTRTLNVESVNDAPALTLPGIAMGDEDGGPITVGFTVADDNPLDGLQLGAASSNQDVIADAGINLGGSGADRTLTLALSQDQSGVVTVTVTATDAEGASSSAVVTVTVKAVNDPPALDGIESGPLNYTENDDPTAISSTLTVSDPDSENLAGAMAQITDGFRSGEDVLSVIGTLPQGITAVAFDSTSGMLSLSGESSTANYQQALRQIGYSNTSENPDESARTIGIQVNDGELDSNLLSREIQPRGVNDPPVGGPDVVERIRGEAAAFSVDSLLANDSDLEGDPLTLAGVSLVSANGVSLSLVGGAIQYPANAPDTNDSFKYALSDGKGGVTEVDVTVNLIIPPNAAPELGDDVFQRLSGLELVITVDSLLSNDTDADGDTLTFVAPSQLSANGVPITFDQGAGTVTYPAVESDQPDQFQYLVTDGTVVSRGTVTINVTQPVPGRVSNSISSVQSLGFSPDAGFAGSVTATPRKRILVQFLDLSDVLAGWQNLGVFEADANGKLSWSDPAPGRVGKLYRFLDLASD